MSPQARFGEAGVPALRAGRAFTVLELLVAVGLLIIIIGVVLQITNQTSQIWRSSAVRIQAFQEARAAFEAMTRNLSQATLNTYYDYYDGSGQPRISMTGTNLANFTPVIYDRISDLHFISGHARILLKDSPQKLVTQTHAVFFQAPLGYSAAYDGLDNGLNACGYFLQFDDAAALVPEHVKNTPGYQPRYRSRLMEMTQRTESLGIYDPFAKTKNDWFVKSATTSSRVIAENVIALVLLPKLSSHEDDPLKTGSGVSLAPNYNYNSRVVRGAASDASWLGATPPFPGDTFISYPANGNAVNASRHHQLPPAMRVAMIVLDESSAARLQGADKTLPHAIDLSGTNLFSNATHLDSDIQAVEDICNAKDGNLTNNHQRLTYRVFNTEITLREAKWSAN